MNGTDLSPCYLLLVACSFVTNRHLQLRVRLSTAHIRVLLFQISSNTDFHLFHSPLGMHRSDVPELVTMVVERNPRPSNSYWLRFIYPDEQEKSTPAT